MSKSSRLLAVITGQPWPARCVAAVAVTTMFVVLAASRTTKADSQQYSLVARVDAKNAGLTSSEIVVKIGNISTAATATKASPDIPRDIAIVVDAGPDQAKVLPKEKDLAIALINELAGVGTSFTIVSAGTSSKTRAATLDQSVAIEHIREIASDSGEKTNVAIYDAIGSAVRQLSLSPGFHIIIFIGEGNDGGSRLRYAKLRSLIESNQVAFFATLVADHSLHGTKSILRYGWCLRELTSDATGIFLENPKTPEAKQRLSESVRGLRLITFDAPSQLPGRYKISVSVRRGRGLHAQKAIVIPVPPANTP
jgi:hypothetical protein